jgi:hypothetical protein
MNIENNIKKTSYNYIPPYTTMTKFPIDYSKSMFYKLVCKDLTITDLYVGFTTDFKARKCCHKSNCNNEKAKSYILRVYRFIRENGGFENWDMILIHRQSCIDANEAHTVERGYVETLGATLNCNIPCRTNIEWYADNLEKVKLYKEANVEKMKEKAKIYREANVEKMKEKAKLYREANLEKQKEYSIKYKEANVEKMKEKAKIYREANVEKMKEKAKLYREANLEKQKEYGIKYKEANVEKMKEKAKQHREANVEKMKEKSKLYREANLEKIREYQRKNCENKKRLKQTLD